MRRESHAISEVPASAGLVAEAGLFLGGGLLVGAVVHEGVPALTSEGIDPLAAWMLLSIPCVFAPILAGAALLLRSEHVRTSWRDRLRLRPPSRADWVWALGGLVVVALGSGALMAVCRAHGLDPSPPFARQLEPLRGDRLWMLAVWVVYWPINILGEEFVWRGVLLPRMEARLGHPAWLANALLWGAFHTAFGIGNLIVLLPTLVCVPLVAQRRHNTWLGVVLHAALSGPGFLALALGLV